MTDISLQTRAVTLRIRKLGKEGAPPGLAGAATHWLAIAAQESTRAQPDIKEIKASVCGTIIALMELASRFEFDVLYEVAKIIRKQELELLVVEPSAKCGRKPGIQNKRRKKK